MRLTLAAVLCLFTSIASAAGEFEISIAAGDYDRENLPVSVDISPPTELVKHFPIEVTFPDGTKGPAQITHPPLLGDRPRLNFILPKLEKGKTITVKFTDKDVPAKTAFEFKKNSEDQFEELLFGDRPVLRYMHAKLDETTKDTRHATMKVYHHAYDPEGKRLVTKGPGGLYPHHRGLYYGFNRISYDGKSADTWHCNKGEFQSHEKFVSSDAGPVLGRHVVAVDWHGRQGDVFAKELREMTVYNTAGGTLIEFASRLESTGSKIKLDGDPQHAGFQFRASQDVPDKTAKLTYYLRPDGKGDPGKFRNWPGDKQHADLPWNALSFVLDEQRFTCCYLDRPKNPKEARYSERDYGRFGSYFEAEIEPGKPLDLSYRIWLQKGEMTVEQVQKLADDFVHPVLEAK